VQKATGPHLLRDCLRPAGLDLASPSQRPVLDLPTPGEWKAELT